MGQATLCETLFGDSSFDGLPTLWKVAYVGVFTLKVALWIGCACLRARAQTFTDFGVGDFVWTRSRRSNAETLASVVFFHIFDVPAAVTDAPVLFHPRKALQPYSVFKKDRHRAWLVGWPSKDEYCVEDKTGAFSNYLIHTVFEFPLALLQVFFTYVQKRSVQIMSIFTLFLCVLSLVANLWNLVTTWRHRQNFYKVLMARVRGGLAGAHSDQERKNVVMACKRLAKHFNGSIPADVLAEGCELGWFEVPVAR